MPDAQNAHVYYEDPKIGLTAGVWDTTTMQEAFGPYPTDEFIVVLEGQFTMLDADGNGIPAHAGQSVIFRQGAPVSWKQNGYLKKFFVTYADPRADMPKVNSAKGGIIPLNPNRTLTHDDLLEHATTPQREQVLYTNEHGNFDVGLWDTQTMRTAMKPFEWHEFAQVLEGEVTLTEEDGTKHHFTNGDVFFVPAGTVCSWHVPTYLRKYYASLDPSIRPRE